MNQLRALMKKIQTTPIVFNDTKPGYFLIKNNLDSIDSMQKLIRLKQLYHQQLPKMPKQYIVRLLFDTFHQSLVYLNQKNQVICGATFRFFKNKTFCQVAFVAVSQSYKGKGIGSKLIATLKNYMQKRHTYYFMTYADNRAVEFFKKQGFSENVSLPQSYYKKCIKQYLGGTLMQCRIHKTFPYLYTKQIIRLQKKILIDTYKSLVLNDMCYDVKTAHELLNQKEKGLETFMKLEDAIEVIPGSLESGWSRKAQEQFMNKKNIIHMLQCHKVLEKLAKHSSSQKYESVIKIIECKLLNEEYQDNQQFKADIINFYKEKSKELKQQEIFDPTKEQRQLFQPILKEKQVIYKSLQDYFAQKQKRQKVQTKSKKLIQIESDDSS